ncbi:MAG: carboxypeptidase regulatory-like domain-containing protein [Planctomycetes bacterium]|nr:carboxypeptidase regulatory-like domain-containing protein [Planctomycetota bacterium]
MQRRVLAVFALVLVVTVGIVVWRSLTGAPATPAATESPVSVPKPAASPGALAGAKPDLARPAEKPAEAQPVAAPEPVAVEPEALADQRAVAAQGGVEFALDVIWPADVPADEQAELVIQGRKTTDIVARLPLTRGGEHRFFLPKEHNRGRVVVEARYLYLDEAVKLDVEKRSKPLSCEPHVGAWVHGRVIFPPGVDEADRDLSKFRVGRRSFRMERTGDFTSSRGFTGETVAIARDGTFEFGGLPADMRHSLILDLSTFPTHEKALESIEAGMSIVHDIELELGASVYGRVVDASGAPIAGAAVGCVPDSDDEPSDGDRNAKSDDAGNFALRGFEPNALRLTAVCKGYLTYHGEPHAYVAGEALREQVITLERGNVLAGIVKWSDGRPADGAALRVTDLGASDDDRIYFGSEPTAAKADAQGAFEISGLGDGPFELRADLTQVVAGEGRKKSRKPWRATLESVEPGRRDLVLVLEPPRALVGTVRDDLGRPVTKFSVTATPIDASGGPNWGRAVRQGFDDETGAFRVEKVHPGTWEVSVEAAGYLDSEDQRVVVADDESELEVVCARGATVSGKVLDPTGKPLAGARLAVSALDDEDHFSSRNCTSDADGEFECTALPTGRVALQAVHSNYAVSERETLDLAPGVALAGLTMHMRLGGSVDVQVLSAAGIDPSDHYVSLSPVEDDRDYEADSESTDDKGHALFAHVVPGRYDVTSWHDGGSSAKGTVEVFEGRRSSIVIGRADGVAIRVSGRVTAGSKPLEGASVSFHFRGKDEDVGNRWEQTDGEGRYELVLDRPGPWGVSVNAGGSSQQEELDVPLAPTFTHDATFGTGSISGTAVDLDRKPIASLGVALVEDGGEHDGRNVGWTQTDGRGRYTFANVSTGRYRVTTRDFDGSSGGLAPGSRDGIQLAAGQKLEGQDLQLAAGGKLDVRIVGVESTGDLWVQVADAADENLASENLDNGSRRVEVDSLPAGRVRVVAWGEGVRSASVYVEVVAGASRTVELELVPEAKATVHLVDANGQAVNGHATLRRSDVDKATDYGGDARAEHVFGRLVAGSYHVEATTEAGAKGSLDFELATGESKTVEVVLSN